MTMFERRGIEIQYNSRNPRDSEQKFAYSCRVCCCKGIRLDCDRCAISHTHETIMQGFRALGERRLQAQVFVTGVGI